MTRPSVAVLLPALDEEGAVAEVVEGFRAQQTRVVVIDNGSRDRTAARARSAGAEVVIEPRRGYGRACLAGISYLAVGAPPQIVVFADCDGTVDPRDLPRLLRPMMERQAELVLGIRTGAGALPEHQRLGNRVLLRVVSRLFGTRLCDVPPFRAVGWTTLRTMDLHEATYGLPLETLLRALLMHARVVEVPVRQYSRRTGRSKVGGTVSGTARAAVRMLLLSLRLRVGILGAP
ncbi:MAG: glycosyltransferase family 2 protein [Thermoplasmata archaeon]|nr:glycosyltransferase family 2 protein [Thermoplasmata archaeon]